MNTNILDTTKCDYLLESRGLLVYLVSATYDIRYLMMEFNECSLAISQIVFGIKKSYVSLLFLSILMSCFISRSMKMPNKSLIGCLPTRVFAINLNF